MRVILSITVYTICLDFIPVAGTLEHWLQFNNREAASMKDTAGSLKDILFKWTEGRPRDLDVAAAVLAAAFRQLRCLQLLNRGWDNLSETERIDLAMSQRCLRPSVKPRLFESEPMHKAMEQWIAAMRNPKDAEKLRELVKAKRGKETVELSQAYLVLEARRHAILRILSHLPSSIMTPDIQDMPLHLWENAVHLLMAEDARDCLSESLYVPSTHPGRGRYPISRKGDKRSREGFKKIRGYMEASGLEFGKPGRFDWFLPVPIPSERTVLRPGVIVKGVIRPPAQETSSSALTRIKRDPKTAPPIPRLAHGLDRILFNPSVHWLQDPASGVFNFSPQIQSIPPLKSFDYDGVTPFVPSSQDTTLRTVAKDQKKQFTGSTSSLTFLLTHIYYLISRSQKPDISYLSSAFNGATTMRTTGMLTPGSIRINYDKTTETYAFDSSKGPDAHDKFGVEKKNVLTWMGTMLEKFLTLRPKIFNTLLKQATGNINPDDRAQVPKEEAYQYSTSRNFVMRSQLDCVDKRLPGTGVFDIKTRATLAVRHDRLNVKQASAYTIIKQHGLFESFEREIYDLVRSAMIKYNFQARIGNMAGIFLAYHNTAKILGFQYLSVEDMDTMLFGSHLAGNRVFDKCIGILDMLAENIVKDWPRKTIEITFEGKQDRLRVWVEHNPKGAKPKVVEYTLEVLNYVNGQEVTGTPPLSDPDCKWDVRYKMQRLIGYSHSGDEVFRRYKRARKAQEWINKLVLPPGVSSDAEIRTLWEDIDLSLPSTSNSHRRRISQRDVKKLRRHFMKPYPLLLQARELADAARKRKEGSPENDHHDG
ncbi:hypothetical protein M407DRAFT_29620 [Tulasnella calospora MUT 4182]|uniref:Pet127-domain-containing protein n=1 Tax=Tulasnella calospora MUT 4182 TaxID=1051891 RepID=A0A0C3Q9T1_9AGAM|nr:hypothetical protein M407DRAFT_29620 [Tulasnella calospora MUT 4182]